MWIVGQRLSVYPYPKLCNEIGGGQQQEQPNRTTSMEVWEQPPPASWMRSCFSGWRSAAWSRSWSLPSAWRRGGRAVTLLSMQRNVARLPPVMEGLPARGRQVHGRRAVGEARAAQGGARRPRRPVRGVPSGRCRLWEQAEHKVPAPGFEIVQAVWIAFVAVGERCPVWH